jgi:hypothetical protein
MNQGLINPSTGRPFPAQERAISDKDLMQILQVHDHKLQALNIQLTQLGLFTEYLVERIQMTTDADDSPIITMEMDQFPDWADARLSEIRKEAERMGAEKAKEQAQKAKDYLENTPGANVQSNIQLNE